MVGVSTSLPPKMGNRSDPPLQKSLTSTDFRLTNAIFTGLRFEVEQALCGLSATAQLLVKSVLELLILELGAGTRQSDRQRKQTTGSNW